jgi:PAS domain S-box-containing protein
LRDSDNSSDTVHSESLFRQALESVPDAVVEVDQDGKIASVNGKAEQLFGYDRSELVGQPVEVLIPEELRERHGASRASYASGAVRREMGTGVSFAGQRKDGSRFSADVALSTVSFGLFRGPRTIAFVRDVTHLRRAEIAEREVLEKTLIGLSGTLNRLLSFSAPLLHERSQSIREIMAHLTSGTGRDSWQYQLAGELSLIGCVSVPISLFEKVWSGVVLTERERNDFRVHPSIARKLIAPIPRLENVATIVGMQHAGRMPGDDFITNGVRLLQLALNADRLFYQGLGVADVIERLRGSSHLQHPIDLLENYKTPRIAQARTVSVTELKPGMTLDEDFCTSTGMLIALRGTTITSALMERIENFARSARKGARLRIRIGPAQADQPEPTLM